MKVNVLLWRLTAHHKCLFSFCRRCFSNISSAPLKPQMLFQVFNFITSCTPPAFIDATRCVKGFECLMNECLML